MEKRSMIYIDNYVSSTNSFSHRYWKLHFLATCFPYVAVVSVSAYCGVEERSLGLIVRASREYPLLRQWNLIKSTRDDYLRSHRSSFILEIASLRQCFLTSEFEIFFDKAVRSTVWKELPENLDTVQIAGCSN